MRIGKASLTKDAQVQSASATILVRRPVGISTNPIWQKILLRLVSVLSPLLLLALWEITANAHLIDVRFFPAPSTIFQAFITLWKNGELLDNTKISLIRILLGFLWGAIPGILLGLLMGIIPLFRAALQPIIDATFPIPKVALFPLFLVIFGLGEASMVAVIATAVVYLVLINTLAGVINIPSIYTDVGRSFQASPWRFFWDIALPGALPFIFAGLKLGMSVALLVIITAEFSSAHSGIGYLVWNAWSLFEVDQMYAGLVMVAILGILLTLALNVLERLLLPWRR